MCSADLKEFIETYHLDLSMDGNFNPRDAFGSHDDSDHVYNTPRAWFMERYLNPHTKKWDGPDADYTPVSEHRTTRMPHTAINRGKGHTAPSVSIGPISFLSSRCARITKETTAFCSGLHLRQMHSMCWFRSTPM